MMTHEAGQSGLCNACGMPYYHGEMVKEDDAKRWFERFFHVSCKIAEARSGGWTVTTCGPMSLFVANKPTETENRYFLIQKDNDGSYSSYRLESLTFVMGDRHARARWIDLAHALLDKRVTEPNKDVKEYFSWSSNSMEHLCRTCGIPIFGEEPCYINPGTQARRHVYTCTPEQWNSHKPAKGGGMLFYPKKDAKLPLTQQGHAWEAIYYRARKTSYGTTRRYFKRLGRGALAVALGRVSEEGAVNWLSDTVPTPERADHNESENCPRCGKYGQYYGKEGMRCYSCKYEYPRRSQKIGS